MGSDKNTLIGDAIMNLEEYIAYKIDSCTANGTVENEIRRLYPTYKNMSGDELSTRLSELQMSGRTRNTAFLPSERTKAITECELIYALITGDLA